MVTAGDGTRALQAIREHQPRLIVLDLMLPELDGLGVLRCVREESDLRVLLLSARGCAADRVYGIHEGQTALLAARIPSAPRAGNIGEPQVCVDPLGEGLADRQSP